MLNPEVDALIIRHLADVEAAQDRLYETITDTLSAAIDETARAWAESHHWAGGFEFEENEDLWIAPTEWRVPGDDPEDYKCWFELAGTDEMNKDWAWPTYFTGLFRSQTFLYFRAPTFMGVTKPQWKKFFADRASPLRKAGFRYDEGSGNFRAPFRISTEALATAFVEDDFDEALRPLRDALDLCRTSKDLFDELAAEAERTFKAA